MLNKSRLIFIFGLMLFLSAKSQVIVPPALQCVTNDNVNGNITLSWANPPVNPCGAFVQYTIYASSNGPNGPYDSVIAVTNQSATTYTLTNYLATSQNWYFYMEADYNCPGATVLQSDTVNNLNPATPQLVNVTVTANNQVIINWLPSTSPQVYAYVVFYYLPNGNAVGIDTVYGRLNTTATDTIGTPNTVSEVYTVAALDSCGKIGSYSTAPHNTILVNETGTSCERQIALNWNKYNNWPGLAQYEIFVSRNSGPYGEVATTDSNTLSYLYTDFNDGDSLSVYIRAINAADTTIISNSNQLNFKASIVQPPSYIYATNATVDAQNHIDITWTIDSIAQLLYYKMIRGSDTTNLADLAQFPVPTPLQHFQTYIDSSDITPGQNPYVYQVDAYDSCQSQYLSTYVKTVSLQGELYDYYVAHLSWNDFLLKYATVTKYNLYRDYGTGYQLIQTFLPGTNAYFDSLQQFLGERGTFCYKIEAVYTISLPAPSNYTATLSSFSNEACIIHRPVIYIPNAFSPGGDINTEFKPTIIYGNPQGYSMLIFNRWGAKIFESDDLAVGWDGTDHGKALPIGGYAYLIQFTADDGVVVERKGIVLLVR
ncbi:MAG TPA: gliding motility-associated C-terminal domain-containing protein [Chitinophagales bacterium]|nr:gliding motility-associated C-terminal domain-containing protein [Chitinophagales bacterium]